MSDLREEIGFADPDGPLDPEAPYDAGDRRAVKAKQKTARIHEDANRKVLRQLMGSNEGRAYVYEVLEFCHIWKSSFAYSGLAMAHMEGQRTVGLRLHADLMLACPERYMEMVKEANGERSS